MTPEALADMQNVRLSREFPNPIEQKLIRRAAVLCSDLLIARGMNYRLAKAVLVILTEVNEECNKVT